MNTQKYTILPNNRITHNGRTLYRIQALKSFNDVQAGDLGGFIEKPYNLSQDGNCWVYDNAKVFDNARISESAQVYNRSQVYGAAIVSGFAKVSDQAEVFECADIYGLAEVFDQGQVFGFARVFDGASVYGYAKVFNSAKIFNHARVTGEAKVFGEARVFGDASIRLKAELSQSQWVCSGVVKTDLLKNLPESIRAQTGLGVFNNKVIAYKQVRKDLSSFYDIGFKYVVGETVEEPNAEISNKGCAAGLHFSNMNYWNKEENTLESVFLAAEIDLDDIITVQQGKIRCKRAKILGAYEIQS